MQHVHAVVLYLSDLARKAQVASLVLNKEVLDIDYSFNTI